MGLGIRLVRWRCLRPKIFQEKTPRETTSWKSKGKAEESVGFKEHVPQDRKHGGAPQSRSFLRTWRLSFILMILGTLKQGWTLTFEPTPMDECLLKNHTWESSHST